MTLIARLPRFPRRSRAAVFSLLIAFIAASTAMLAPNYVTPIRQNVGSLDRGVYDWLFNHRGAEPSIPTVCIVQIDKNSIKNMEDMPGHFMYPFPRNVHARVLRNLKAAGARVIGIDILFDSLRDPLPNGQPSPSDQNFIAALKECGNVVLAADFSSTSTIGGGQNASADQTSSAQDFPHQLFRDSAMAFGPVDVPEDDDGWNRRFALALKHPSLTDVTKDFEWYPQFPVQIAAAYRKIPPANLVPQLEKMQFGGTPIPPSPDDWNSYEPGHSARICFAGRPRQSCTFLEYDQVFNATPPAASLPHPAALRSPAPSGSNIGTTATETTAAQGTLTPEAGVPVAVLPATGLSLAALRRQLAANSRAPRTPAPPFSGGMASMVVPSSGTVVAIPPPAGGAADVPPPAGTVVAIPPPAGFDANTPPAGTVVAIPPPARSNNANRRRGAVIAAPPPAGTVIAVPPPGVTVITASPPGVTVIAAPPSTTSPVATTPVGTGTMNGSNTVGEPGAVNGPPPVPAQASAEIGSENSGLTPAETAAAFQRLQEAVNGKVVLIGSTEESEHDNFYTPLRDWNDPKRPGVEIHANIIHTLLAGHYYGTAPEWIRQALIIGLVLLTVILTLILRPYRAAVPVLLLMAGAAWLDVILFSQRLFLRPTEILAAIVLAYLLETVFLYLTEEARAKHARRHFGRYVGPKVLEEVLDSSHVQLGGELRHVAIMFTDIQGFTSLSETLPPDIAVKLLNLYLTKMVDLIFKYDGTLDKFMGDGIMAYFGAPTKLPNPEYQAVMCGVEMQQVLRDWHPAWGEHELPNLRKRIGIHSGEVIVGEVGSASQVGYTLIGDAVNVAARLEPLNKNFDTKIMISEAVRERLPDSIAVEYRGELEIRGRKETIRAYSVPVPDSSGIGHPEEGVLK